MAIRPKPPALGPGARKYPGFVPEATAGVDSPSAAAIRSTAAGRLAGVALESGKDIDQVMVVTAVHPTIAPPRLIDPAPLSRDLLDDIRGRQTSSGMVKANLALDRLPVVCAH